VDLWHEDESTIRQQWRLLECVHAVRAKSQVGRMFAPNSP
jgi:hypothetical protein